MGIQPQKKLHVKIIYPKYPCAPSVVTMPRLCEILTILRQISTPGLPLLVNETDRFSEKFVERLRLERGRFFFLSTLMSVFFLNEKGRIAVAVFFCRPRVQSSLSTRIVSHGKRSFFCHTARSRRFRKMDSLIIVSSRNAMNCAYVSDRMC